MTRETSISRRVGVGLSVLAVIEILTGFAVQTLIVGVVGANRFSDAYFVSAALPQFFLTVLGAPVVSVLIPLLAATDDGHERSRATTILLWTVGIATISAIVAAATSSLWLPRIFPSFTGSEESLVLQLAIVQLLSIAPTAGCAVWKASCYARRRFLGAEAISVGGAVVSLVALVILLPRYGVIAAVWITLLRYTFTLLCLLAFERATRPAPLRGEFAREVWQRTRPLVAGAVYFKSEPLVDQHFASLAPAGDLSVFSFCRTLLSSALMVLSQALVSPIIPEVAVLAKRGEWVRLRAKMHQRMLFVGGAATLGMIAIAIAGPYVLDLVASLSPRAAAMPLHMLWVLMLLLAGIPIAAGTTQIVTASYYALGETSLLTKIGIVTYTIGIGCKLVGFHLYGLWGLAIATSIYYVLDTGAQWVVLEAKLQRAIKQASETAAPSESS